MRKNLHDMKLNWLDIMHDMRPAQYTCSEACLAQLRNLHPAVDVALCRISYRNFQTFHVRLKKTKCHKTRNARDR